MNVLFMTNTYLPIVGGLEKSVETFSSLLRQKGHKALIVAPEFKHQPSREEHVFRIPAIQNFNGTDFTVQLPAPSKLTERIEEFKPDIVHSQHPYLIGDTAMRIAGTYNIPLVFTYHTRYEMNTHYLPGDSKVLKQFVQELALGYCKLCDKVIAPSKSIADFIISHGLARPVDVVPTGIDLDKFQKKEIMDFREFAGIPKDAFCAGYLGRVAEEKNLKFLAQAITGLMNNHDKMHFLVVGDGPYLKDLVKFFEKKNLRERLHTPGVCKGKKLAGAYHAMDLFVFASKSETQGLVLAEAMAAGTPVVGIDAPGTKDLVRDGYNGRLVSEDLSELIAAVEWFLEAEKENKNELMQNARKTAEEFSLEKCFAKLLKVYKSLLHSGKEDSDNSVRQLWERSKRGIKAELSLAKNFLDATESAIIQIYKDKGE